MTTLVPLFLDGSSSFLQVTRPTIKARMSLNFDKIPSLTSELAALEQATSKLIISWMGLKFSRIRPGTYE